MKKRDRKKRLRKRLERISQAGKGKPESTPPSTDPTPAGLRFEVIPCVVTADDVIDCEFLSNLPSTDPEP